MKELYEITFNQFCENWLINSRYSNKYKSDETLWNNKKVELQEQWKQILIERAEVGTIPEIVIRNFVNLYSIEYARTIFRGRLLKGLELWEQTQTNKIYRTRQAYSVEKIT